jgi:hypothetical protein
MDCNYRRLKNYNDTPKESFELNSGYIDIYYNPLGKNYYAKMSDITSTLILYTKNTTKSKAAVIDYTKDKELPLGESAIIPADNRFSFLLDKIPMGKNITSIDIFIRTNEGLWSPVGAHLQQKYIGYDQATNMLHIGKVNIQLSSIFPLEGGAVDPPKDVPVIRIIVTW